MITRDQQHQYTRAAKDMRRLLRRFAKCPSSRETSLADQTSGAKHWLQESGEQADFLTSDS